MHEEHGSEAQQPESASQWPAQDETASQADAAAAAADQRSDAPAAGSDEPAAGHELGRPTSSSLPGDAPAGDATAGADAAAAATPQPAAPDQPERFVLPGMLGSTGDRAEPDARTLHYGQGGALVQGDRLAPVIVTNFGSGLWLRLAAGWAPVFRMSVRRAAGRPSAGGLGCSTAGAGGRRGAGVGAVLSY